MAQPRQHRRPRLAEIEGGAPLETVAASLDTATAYADPYRHWLLQDVLPSDVVQRLNSLPFLVQDLGGLSGAREAHNDSRVYFQPAIVSNFPICRMVAEAFQARGAVAAIHRLTGAALDGCFLRIEYTQDTDGFWLAPHTDLGVKRFTLTCCLDAGGQRELGTDMYDETGTWAKRTPFEPGLGVAFVPSDKTWHGFERRPIKGVRRMLIVNYVTSEWRARGQLAFPDQPIP